MLINFQRKLIDVVILTFAFCVTHSGCATRGYYYDYPTRPTRSPRAYSSPNYSQYYTPNSIQSVRNLYRSNSITNPTTSTTTTTTMTTARPSVVTKYADTENAKFVGASNQEVDDLNGDGKTLLLKKKLKKLSRLRPFGSPCLPFGRDAYAGINQGAQGDEQEQGRFLFDVNVYQVYQGAGGYGGGCGGYGGGYGGGLLGGGGGGGGGLLGGLLSDPIAPVAPYPYRPLTPFATWLSLFAPGILQNSLAATARPLADPSYAQAPNLQNDPEVDPNYNPPLVPIRRPPPNRVYFDSAGAAPVTPAQLVGGVATTVNGIIQQLTGNVQPVYQSAYRTSRSYG